MSLPPNWRQLQLFDVVPIRDPNYNTSDALYSSNTLTAISASRSYMVMSANGCYLKIASKDFVTLRSFMAYDADYRISFVEAVPRSDLLVTLAERQGYPSILKLWDLHKLVNLEIDSDKQDAETLLKTKFQTQVYIQNGDNSYPISCFTFNPDVSCLAVGYTNGKVILVRGDLIRDRGAKQRLIYESPDPVTGLHFNEYHGLLYVTTTSKILTVTTTGRNQGRPLKVLSKKTGVPLRCSDIDPETQDLIVGTDESLRYYNHISKSHTINFEMNKRLIHRYSKNYLLIVSPVQENNGTSSKVSSRVIIIDLNYKHISFNLTIPNTVITEVFQMWGDLCLLSSDGMLYKLNEKPINQQIELILQRESFQLAYMLAKENKLPVQTLLKVCKLHGNYLYSQQEFEESIKAFIRSLEYYQDPKLVLTDRDESLGDFIMNIITKFKDASNISHLTEFLYQLYKLKIANTDHVTLLLCCFCKLKLVDRIRIFIAELNLNPSAETSSVEDKNRQTNTKADYSDLDFPLIINLFKECGYYNEVIHLLYKLNQPSLIVDIQLNDLKKPQRSLRYIKSLSIDDLLLILIEHSKVLLDNSPIETTELLIKVFTGKYVPNEDSKLLDNDENFRVSDETKTANEDENTSPLNSYKSFLAYLSGHPIEDDQATITSAFNNEPTYLPPRPSLIFPSFINNPNEFVIFLEACIEAFEKYQGNTNDKKELLITLFEMYLSLSVKETENRDEWVQKAENLILNFQDLLDESTLQLVSHIYGFNCDDVLKKDGYEEEAFRSAQLNKDVKRCFEIVEKHGDSKPELYKLLLRFVVSAEDVFEQVDRKQFNYIINKLKTLNLASPLEIIQILSTTEFATIGLIRDYLIDIIDVANQEITNNEKLVEFYEKESIKNSYKITELKTKPFIIQNNKCSACNLKLDFPVIHFKCKHSFHQRCLNDNFLSSNDSLNAQPTCSICVNDIDSLQTLRDEQFRSKDEVEIFNSALQEATDKFKVISNYLGKGVMEGEYIQVSDDA